MRLRHLKNSKFQFFEESTLVPRELCLLLNGTPLQNSIEELWDLINFSDSDTFESQEAIVEIFW